MDLLVVQGTLKSLLQRGLRRLGREPRGAVRGGAMSGSRAPGPEVGASGAEPPGAALSVDVAGLLAQLA